MGQDTEKSNFLYNFNNFTENWAWRGKLLYFIVEVYK